MSTDLCQAAHRYFLQKPVLKRIGLVFCEKYRSLGHWGGIAVLAHLSAEDKADLSAFLREDMTQKEPVRVRYAMFAAAWSKTRFAALPFCDFLTELYPGRLMTKKEVAGKAEAVRQKILRDLLCRYPSGFANEWLQALQDQTLRFSHLDFYEREELLRLVAESLFLLPEIYERLPFFANRVCGNPHALDWDTDAGKLFLQALSYLSGDAAHDTVEEKSDLLYAFHLLRDDILNFATVYGLAAWNGKNELIYWRLAAESLAPMNLPSREIVRAERIVPAAGVSGKNFAVYLVENSGVFSTLLDALQEKKIVLPLLCLHGQLKTASWALLDRLAKNGAIFWYSGDFDPEGLIIAQKLRQRYECVRLWHFSAEEYQRTEISLPAGRLKRLQGIVDAELYRIAKRMQSWKCAFYQESLADLLLEDLYREENRERLE